MSLSKLDKLHRVKASNLQKNVGYENSYALYASIAFCLQSGWGALF